MKARVPMQSQHPRRTPACEPDGVVRRASGADFADNRPAAIAQRQLAEGINAGALQQVMRVAHEALQNSPRVTAQRRLARGLPAIPQTAQRVEDEEPLQGKSAVTQRAEDEELLQGKTDPIQRQEPEEEEPLQGRFGTAQRLAEPARPVNRTGLPDTLKTGIESLSGLSMDHVKVHYNSAQPAQLNALAYAQGSDIHLAPGQERHLPHEAWHVVQQAQGRVRPTAQMKEGVAVNDDQGLELEADVMGTRALATVAQFRSTHEASEGLRGWPAPAQRAAPAQPVLRRVSSSPEAIQCKLEQKYIGGLLTAIRNGSVQDVSLTAGEAFQLDEKGRADMKKSKLPLAILKLTWGKYRIEIHLHLDKKVNYCSSGNARYEGDQAGTVVDKFSEQVVFKSPTLTRLLALAGIEDRRALKDALSAK